MIDQSLVSACREASRQHRIAMAGGNPYADLRQVEASCSQLAAVEASCSQLAAVGGSCSQLAAVGGSCSQLPPAAICGGIVEKGITVPPKASRSSRLRWGAILAVLALACSSPPKTVTVPPPPLTTTAPVDLAPPIKAQGDVADSLVVSAGQARHAAQTIRIVVPEAVKPAVEPSAKEMEVVAASNDAGAKALTVSKDQTAAAQGQADAIRGERDGWKARADTAVTNLGIAEKRATDAEAALAKEKEKWTGALHWALIIFAVASLAYAVYGGWVLRSPSAAIMGAIACAASITINVYLEQIAFWGVLAMAGMAVAGIGYFIWKTWRDQQSKDALIHLNEIQKQTQTPEVKKKLFGTEVDPDGTAWNVLPDHTIDEVDASRKRQGFDVPTGATL